MINEDNLNAMYETLIENQELTTKKLNECGFNSKDLASLIENGTLERIKRGHYSLKSVDSLFIYGKRLISMKRYDVATSCFKKCYELDPNHSSACFQLFFRCIQNRNYEEALEYFNHFYNSDNIYYNSDNNYYLYLLSMITDLPEQYKQYAKNLKYKDIKIAFGDKRFKKISSQKTIRLLSLRQQFALAIKQIDLLMDQNNKLNAQEILVKTLLNQALEVQKKNKQHIIRLINEKRYEKLIEFLELIQERHELSVADKCVLSLTKDLVEIIKTDIIPEKNLLINGGLFNAIFCKDYELAFSLSSQYIEEANIKPNDNAIYSLLVEIKNLIDSKKTVISSKIENQQAVLNNEMKKQEEKNIVSPFNNTIDCKNVLSNIIGYLMKNDLDNAFLLLGNYLDTIGKRQYETLIMNLIKISIIEHDNVFIKPMMTLTYISKNNCQFNISEYIQNFYDALAQNNFEMAKIYLDIIYNLNNLVQCNIAIEKLEQLLNDTEKMVTYQQNDKTLDKIDTSVSNVDEPLKLEVLPTQLGDEQIDNLKTIRLKKGNYNDTKLIDKKLNDLYKNGIVLLKPMNNERRKEIHSIVKGIDDVVSFDIGPDYCRQVVLRHKPYIGSERLEIKELMRTGSIAYNNGDYNTCIKCYRKLLGFGIPNSYIYAKLGLAYLKTGRKKIAIDYLIVANELSKKNNDKYDFTEFISRLTGVEPDEERKPYVKMSISAFNNDLNNNYGVENVETVAELVASGMTFEDACSNISVDENQRDIIALIFAKECYAQEDYLIGDEYLKKVEKSANKSKQVKDLLSEITKNKRFYKNRVVDNQKRLVLISKK